MGDSGGLSSLASDSRCNTGGFLVSVVGIWSYVFGGGVSIASDVVNYTSLGSAVIFILIM